MTKEEIKEMINATINDNGERSITGKALNLALNAIVDAMGEGGGLDTVYFVPQSSPMEAVDYPFTEEEISALVAHNANVYTKLSDKFRKEKSIPLVCLDMSMFISMMDGQLYGHSIIVNNVVAQEITSQVPMKLSSASDFYNDGDIGIIFSCESVMFGSLQVALTPNGYIVNTNDEE